MSTDNATLALTNKQSLWLAAIAACAGLALAWRWWISRRILRNRALQVLGYGGPVGRAMPAGFRYAVAAVVAAITVFVLTPVSSGVGDVERSSVVKATGPAPIVIVVEQESASGVTVVVQGNVVEIRIGGPDTQPSVAVFQPDQLTARPSEQDGEMHQPDSTPVELE